MPLPLLSLKSAQLSGVLSQKQEKQLFRELLTEFKDVFAWTYKEMPGLNPAVAMHFLHIAKGKRPVKQAPRKFRPELEQQIIKEVEKLISAGFIREIKFPRWISSIVPVKKKNGQIRVCVDFRDLNEACPKDEFPLPYTELLIDSTALYDTFSFMDGYSGYNQIKMATRQLLHSEHRWGSSAPRSCHSD